MWVFLAVFSAFFLGIYDVFKKVSVNNNAVLIVLFYSTLSGALMMLPLWILSERDVLHAGDLLYVPPISLQTHLLIVVKTVIVLTSWILAFFALKHLPLTIVAPIRATGPLWTLIGALVIYGERLSLVQWSGIIVTLFFFYLFSTAGKLEGISFRKNKWIMYIIGGTITGAISGLYDKFLISRVDRMAVQCFFSIYQVLIMGPLVLVLRKRIKKNVTFQWRWSIPMIGIFLIFADFLYFYALSYPESYISIVSALRRGSVVVAFALGALWFKEKHIGIKGIYLVGILAGIGLLLFGSTS